MEGQRSWVRMAIPAEPIGSIPRPVELMKAVAGREVALRDLTGLTILVVDDHADARDLMRLVLGSRNARVVCAANADEALVLVERERPHVLVSDIGMPVVDGYELLRRVRALGAERGGDVPAIALTAFARAEDRTRALCDGFAAHLSKPVEPLELVATIASVA